MLFVATSQFSEHPRSVYTIPSYISMRLYNLLVMNWDLTSALVCLSRKPLTSLFLRKAIYKQFLPLVDHIVYVANHD
ncbi:hypothetical protein GQ55_3G484300 [Panicum hallii var. hallii]|jgi:hypothetical protein|uniref:Uncharacterized protein n=1 Tax=Panicum hallii var. hallii TaxID=1504633 RepID=A0A2T7EJR1_9POAL|nr:hypothetical protein GQ55_3G484300 [Panicum hallii var. hallii]